MIAAIFELKPSGGHKQEYFDLADALNTQLRVIDGFIFIERFRSLTNPDKYLSLSFWRDEAAIKHWRNQAKHRKMQAESRRHVFSDFRLRVVEVIRDYGMVDREQAPQGSQCKHCTL